MMVWLDGGVVCGEVVGWLTHYASTVYSIALLTLLFYRVEQAVVQLLGLFVCDFGLSAFVSFF